MRTDARVRYTKMVIKNSFAKLLAEKPLAKVTVKEICELSEINRATFYKYYCDPFDLLDKIEHELYRTLFSENGDPHFPTHIFSSCYRKFVTINDNKQFQQLKPSEKKWLFYFIAQGCSGILSQWIESGMEEPISEVTAFTDKLVQNTMKSL